MKRYSPKSTIISNSNWRPAKFKTAVIAIRITRKAPMSGGRFSAGPPSGRSPWGGSPWGGPPWGGPPWGGPPWGGASGGPWRCTVGSLNFHPGTGDPRRGRNGDSDRGRWAKSLPPYGARFPTRQNLDGLPRPHCRFSTAPPDRG